MTAISEKIVKELPVPTAGYSIVYFSGAALQGRVAPSGFGVRTTSAGRKAFIWFHRHNGKKHLETIGAWEPKAGGLTVYDAIDKCIKRKQAIAKGVDQKGNDVDARPVRTRRSQDGNKPAQMNVAALIDHFTKRYLDGGNLRTAGMIKSQLDRLVKPRIGRLRVLYPVSGEYSLRAPVTCCARGARPVAILQPSCVALHPHGVRRRRTKNHGSGQGGRALLSRAPKKASRGDGVAFLHSPLDPLEAAPRNTG